MSLIDLPRDTVFNILAFMNLTELSRLCSTSSSIRNICSDPNLWITRYIYEFSESFPNINLDPKLIYLNRIKTELIMDLKSNENELINWIKDTFSKSIYANPDPYNLLSRNRNTRGIPNKTSIQEDMIEWINIGNGRTRYPIDMATIYNDLLKLNIPLEYSDFILIRVILDFEDIVYEKIGWQERGKINLTNKLNAIPEAFRYQLAQELYNEMAKYVFKTRETIDKLIIIDDMLKKIH